MTTTYLIVYKGQTESPYTYWESSRALAVQWMSELQIEYPTREWRIEEKDVS